MVPAGNRHAEAPRERAADPNHEERERQMMVIEEEMAEQRARDEATRVRRNLLDRTRYHGDKMVELEVQLARARRRDQDRLVADILEDMDVVRARATEAG